MLHVSLIRESEIAGGDAEKEAAGCGARRSRSSAWGASTRRRSPVLARLLARIDRADPGAGG